MSITYSHHTELALFLLKIAILVIQKSKTTDCRIRYVSTDWPYYRLSIIQHILPEKNQAQGNSTRLLPSQHPSESVKTLPGNRGIQSSLKGWNFGAA